MANLRNLTPSQIRDMIANLNYVTNGQPGDRGMLDMMPDDALNESNFDFLRQTIDANVQMPGQTPGLDALFGGQQQRRKGAKDNVSDMVGRANGTQPGLPLNDYERRALESVLLLNNYEAEPDGDLTQTEIGFLTDYTAKFDIISSETIADQNGAAIDAEIARVEQAEAARLAAEESARVAAETAALQQAQIEGQLTAALVAGGYLDLSKVDLNNPQALAEARVFAVDTMFQNNMAQANYDPADLSLIGPYNMSDYFDPANGYMPNQAALDRAIAMTGGASMQPEQLQAMVDSNNPAMIEIAQHYMQMKGENITVTGATDRVTIEAAERMIKAPVGDLPATIYDAQGGIKLFELRSAAERGQITLPTNEADIQKYLGADAVTALALPTADDPRAASVVTTREEYIAQKMIADNPALYEQFTTDENARRAGMSVQWQQAAIEQPVMDVPVAETNNPLNLVVSGTEDYALANGAVTIANDAVAQTPDGTAIFNEDDATYAFVDYLRANTIPDAEGIHRLTMGDALRLYEDAKQVVGDERLEWMEGALPGNSTQFDMQYADRLEMLVVGRDKYGDDFDFRSGQVEPGATFSLSDPNDIENLMTAVSAAAKSQGGELNLDGYDGNIVLAFAEQFPDDVDSLVRVAQAGGIKAQENVTRYAEYEPSEQDILDMYRTAEAAELGQTNAVALGPVASVETASPVFIKPAEAPTPASLMMSEINLRPGLVAAFDQADANQTGVSLDAEPEALDPRTGQPRIQPQQQAALTF